MVHGSWFMVFLAGLLLVNKAVRVDSSWFMAGVGFMGLVILFRLTSNITATHHYYCHFFTMNYEPSTINPSITIFLQ